MGLFRRKIKIEDYVEGLVRDKLPRAVTFFKNENSHSRHSVTIEEHVLLEIGAAMILFFLGKFYPDTEKKNIEMMSRAYKPMEGLLPQMNARPAQVHGWWKAFTDGLIFQSDEERLRIACRLAWEKVLPHKPYREASPLKTFGYFLEMEIEGVKKLKVV